MLDLLHNVISTMQCNVGMLVLHNVELLCNVMLDMLHNIVQQKGSLFSTLALYMWKPEPPKTNLALCNVFVPL